MLKVNNREKMNLVILELHEPVICEVGVRFGENLKNLITPNVKNAYGVDIWMNTNSMGQNDNLYPQDELDRQYNNVVNMFKSDDRVKIIRDFSVNSSHSFPDEYFDFVYLDADHTYQSVKEDLESWWPKIKKGGILSGHDYIDGDLTIRLGHSVRFGVVEAVEEFKKIYNISDENFHLTDEEYASYFIKK